MAQILAELSRHPVYACAPRQVLAKLAQTCTTIALQPKEVLYEAGSPAQRVFLLTHGMLRVFQRSREGLETTVTTLMAPSSFGEKAVIAQSRGDSGLGYPEFTSALTAAQLIEVPAEAFLDFLRAAPGSALELLWDICRRFTESARREVDVMVPVPQRLASLLLSYASVAGIASTEGTLIKLPLTNAELANGIGAVTRTVARVLAGWKRLGMVSRRKGWLLIRDPGALARVCGGALLHQASLGRTAK